VPRVSRRSRRRSQRQPPERHGGGAVRRVRLHTVVRAPSRHCAHGGEASRGVGQRQSRYPVSGLISARKSEMARIMPTSPIGVPSDQPIEKPYRWGLVSHAKSYAPASAGRSLTSQSCPSTVSRQEAMPTMLTGGGWRPPGRCRSGHPPKPPGDSGPHEAPPAVRAAGQRNVVVRPVRRVEVRAVVPLDPADGGVALAVARPLRHPQWGHHRVGRRGRRGVPGHDPRGEHVDDERDVDPPVQVRRPSGSVVHAVARTASTTRASVRVSAASTRPGVLPAR